MSESNDKPPKERMTKGQLLRHVLKRMGQQMPEEQVYEFQRKYLANWMSKQGTRGASSPTRL